MPDMTIEVVDGSSGLSGVGHENESSSSRQVVKSSQDDCMFHGTVLGEESLELVGSSV